MMEKLHILETTLESKVGFSAEMRNDAELQTLRLEHRALKVASDEVRQELRRVVSDSERLYQQIEGLKVERSRLMDLETRHADLKVELKAANDRIQTLASAKFTLERDVQRYKSLLDSQSFEMAVQRHRRAGSVASEFSRSIIHRMPNTRPGSRPGKSQAWRM